VITLTTFKNRPEAEVIKSVLAESGISSVVQADDQGGMYPSLAFIQGVELKVYEKDLKKAQEILEEMSAAPGEEP
jgi:hypothetical protein